MSLSTQGLQVTCRFLREGVIGEVHSSRSINNVQNSTQKPFSKLLLGATFNVPFKNAFVFNCHTFDSHEESCLHL